MSKYGNSTMYSGTPCDECGGPTLTMPSGSIWCSSEDGHKSPGGHFVTRVAFERAPGHQATSRRATASVGVAPRKTTHNFRKDTGRHAEDTRKTREADGFDMGLDGFIGEDAR